MTKKFLKKGVIPTVNLPVKSIEKKTVARKGRSVVNDIPVTERKHQYYKSLSELKSRAGKLCLKSWSEEDSKNENIFILRLIEEPYLLPKFKLWIDESLSYTVSVFGYFIPDDHFLYKDFKRSMRNVTVTDLLFNLDHLQVCNGVKTPDLATTAISHVVPVQVDIFECDDNSSPFPCKEFIRAKECKVLKKRDEEKDLCIGCSDLLAQQFITKRKSRAQLSVPAKLKAPIMGTSIERVRLTLKETRLQNKSLTKELEKMRGELEQYSKPVGNELDGDLLSIIDGNADKMTPFMKLFWQQQKLISSKSAVARRYHPMIIRWCLSISSKSASAYDEIRETFKDGGMLELPSRRTLRNYRNAVTPQCGFNPDIIEELIYICRDFKGVQRYVVLLLDEMKVQDNLVWNKYSGDLIGFVDLGDPQTNYGTLQETDAVATHILAFMLRGIQTSLKFILAYFATTSITGYQLFPIFWRAIGLLETKVKLPVIATVCDGASPNRNFFGMHEDLDGKGSASHTYRTVNLFSMDRYIFFFSDPPHLVKTSRNCLHNSGSGKNSRYMWNNGFHLLWSHISRMFYSDLENGLHLMPKLNTAHIELNSFAVMKVNLAAQVLSSTVAKVLRSFGPPDAAATADFCQHIDTFFDCMNVRSIREGHNKIKPFLLPYRSQEDERFIWLKDTFLQYLQSWQESIEKRPEQFKEAEKAKMFISRQTHEGFVVSVNSLIDAVRFLLNQGMEYVLSNRFCQDPLEEYFGKQRGIGRRHENPSVREFGYNDNVIRVQRSVLSIEGNVRGKKKDTSCKRWKQVSNEPLNTKQQIKSRKLDFAKS